MKVAKKLRERMVKVHSGQFLLFQVMQKALPEMNLAIAELRASLAVKDIAIPEARKSLERLAGQLRAIEEAAELDRVAVAKIAAGVGQFMEEHEAQRGRLHEVAGLASLQQYFEVAARGSSGFWLELFDLVDLPVFDEAFEKYARQKPERFLKMFAAGQRTMQNVRHDDPPE